MPSTKRIHRARAFLLTILAFILGAVAAGYLVAFVALGPDGEFPTAPAGEVGSGLHLPLGGDR
jgi:hypothetical protein